MEFGVQFVTHLAPYTVPELVALAARAHAQGFEQLWLNDNARYRGIFVVLTAVAARVPMKVGMAALVPYFHHPVDVAESLAALSELGEGREVSVGLGRGDLGQTPQYVEVRRPLTMLRETATFLRRALAGEAVPFRDFPHLVEYHRLNPDGHLHLAFAPAGPVRTYGAANGPKSLALEGEHMDGIMISGKFLAYLRLGHPPAMLQRARDGAARADPDKRLRVVAELNVSIARDRERAREFPRRQVAHSVLGLAAYPPADLQRLGIEPERIARLRERFAAGATIEEAAALVTDRMVDAYYLAGTPDDVAPRALEIVAEARRLGIDHVAFAKLGPDYAEALDCLAADVLPHLR